jgi:hypothetical protein
MPQNALSAIREIRFGMDAAGSVVSSLQEVPQTNYEPRNIPLPVPSSNTTIGKKESRFFP